LAGHAELGYVLFWRIDRAVSAVEAGQLVHELSVCMVRVWGTEAEVVHSPLEESVKLEHTKKACDERGFGAEHWREPNRLEECLRLVLKEPGHVLQTGIEGSSCIQTYRIAKVLMKQ
jgi:hypothetical protein